MRPMAKIRILVAEDEPTTLKMTQRRLEYEGYEVRIAEDAEAAVVQAQARPSVHLILLDVRLPKGDGYEVCRRLKREAGTAHIPIIVITATESAGDALATKCLAAGADDWLAKPFQTGELMVKIHRALRREGTGNG